MSIIVIYSTKISLKFYLYTVYFFPSLSNGEIIIATCHASAPRNSDF
jgi:hypothetical protein